MTTLQYILGIVVAIFGSGGFWAFLTARLDKKSDTRKMLLGLCFERLIDKCEYYISQGWIPIQEYEDLVEYLYDPYIKSGGNGTAKAMMAKVDKLPNEKEN